MAKSPTPAITMRPEVVAGGPMRCVVEFGATPELAALAESVEALRAELLAMRTRDSGGIFRKPDAAAYLQIHPSTLDRLRAEGLIKYAKDGDVVWFRREWLDAYVDSRAVEPRAPRGRDARALEILNRTAEG